MKLDNQSRSITEKAATDGPRRTISS